MNHGFFENKLNQRRSPRSNFSDRISRYMIYFITLLCFALIIICIWLKCKNISHPLTFLINRHPVFVITFCAKILIARLFCIYIDRVDYETYKTYSEKNTRITINNNNKYSEEKKLSTAPSDDDRISMFSKDIVINLVDRCCNNERVADQIYDIWKDEWEKDCQNRKTGSMDYKLILNLVSEKYQNSFWKDRRNYRLNFFVKKLILCVYIVFAPVATIMQMVWEYLHSENLLVEILSSSVSVWALILEGALVGLMLLLVAVLAKWLDVTKYQETWIRHQNHIYELRTEMFLYINRIGAYYEGDRQIIFVNNFMKIEAGNQQKFVENMENKEQSMWNLVEILGSRNKGD